jgi:hypothetical protein
MVYGSQAIFTILKEQAAASSLAFPPDSRLLHVHME